MVGVFSNGWMFGLRGPGSSCGSDSCEISEQYVAIVCVRAGFPTHHHHMGRGEHVDATWNSYATLQGFSRSGLHGMDCGTWRPWTTSYGCCRN